jgi:CxxC motif-containing protein (DUF1111 family)
MRARLVSLALLSPALHAQDFSALDAAAGKALFERNWVQAPASTSATDGLGPSFNARSCAACHPRGEAGEATLATMNLVSEDPLYGHMLQLRAVPGLQPEVAAQLSFEPAQTIAFADGTEITLSKPRVEFSEQPRLSAAMRRAPSLAGLARLEQVPRDDLQARADPGDSNGDGISGQLAEGRFGWKAQVPTVREQVARALSFDLGLGNPLFPSAAGDCTEQQQACIDAARGETGDEFEAPDVVLDLLVTYLQSLPPPAAPSATGPGAELFGRLGCQACHAGEALTDLLLHDLGPGLAAGSDPDWRTAPLWGLRESGPFLHDGRARSLAEAILWHGGEAATAGEAYRHLNSAERAILHGWLLRL